MSSTAVDANPAGRIPWESLTDDQRKTFVRVLPPDYEADDIRNRWQSIDQQIWLDDWDRGADARKESDDRRQAERERARWENPTAFAAPIRSCKASSPTAPSPPTTMPIRSRPAAISSSRAQLSSSSTD